MLGQARNARSAWFLLLAMLGCAGLGLKDGEVAPPTPAAPAGEAWDLKGKVVVVSVQSADLTDGERARSLRQLIEKANGEKAAALVFEINSKAGYNGQHANLLMDSMSELSIPTHAFVHPSALGLGALLSVSCQTIYMSPVGVIGAAAPTPERNSEGKIETAATAQTLSVVKAQARGQAAAKGRRADVIEAMMDPEVSLRLTIDGKKKSITSGEILTLTSAEATQVVDGAPLLAKAVVANVEELIAKEALAGAVVKTNVANWRADLAQKVETPAKIPDATVAQPAATPTAPTPFGKTQDVSLAGKILVVKIGFDDLRITARFRFMERLIDRARVEKPSALIFDMHTPGGFVWHTTDLMMKLQDLPFPTYTFVNTKAKSAGALVAIATDHIYMKSASTIGAALPIDLTGADIPGDMGKKVRADLISTVENVAIVKGHPKDVCVAFVTTNTQVEREGVVISAKEEVMDLNAIEATTVYDGKPLLAKGIVRDVQEIIQKEGLKGEIYEVKARPMEVFAQWVEAFSFLLIAIGLAGAYLELNHPGFGIPGFISVAAFSLFFFGNYMAENLAGWETALVFIIGATLVIIEVLFLAGGSIVVGLLGGLLMMGALAFALVDRVEITDYVKGGEAAPSLGEVFKGPLLSLLGGIVLTSLLIMAFMRYLPGVGPFRWMVLQTAVPSGTSVKLESPEGTTLSAGTTGVAATDLRPAGKGKFGDAIYDVSSESMFIRKGEAIRIVQVRGDGILIDRAV